MQVCLFVRAMPLKVLYGCFTFVTICHFAHIDNCLKTYLIASTVTMRIWMKKTVCLPGSCIPWLDRKLTGKYVGIQDVVKPRTESLNHVFIKRLCSGCLLFQICMRSCTSPDPFCYEPGDTMYPFFKKELHVFSMKTTTLATVVILFHKYLFHLLFSYL